MAHFSYIIASISWMAAGAAVDPLRLDGLVAAVFTPYNADSSIKYASVISQAKYLERTGVKGVLVAGTTGDSLGLSVSERKLLAEKWAPASKETGLDMMVHVGAEALPDVLELTRHAAKVGAKAIVCMPSTFFKPANAYATALWLKAVGAAAPATPLYYYHIPSMTGVHITMVDLITAIEKVSIPSFVGVKYTGLYENRAFPDLQRAMQLRDGHYEIFSGREEMTVEALALGVKGFVGSQFNFAGDLYQSIHDMWSKKNSTRAVELQSVALDLLYTWLDAVPAGVNGNRLVMDYALSNSGFDVSRQPSLPADAALRKSLGHALDDWCIRAKTKSVQPVMCNSGVTGAAIV